MPNTLLRDAEMRLPRSLVSRAVDEIIANGVILADTAALLIENGGDMHRLEQQIEEQASMEDA